MLEHLDLFVMNHTTESNSEQSGIRTMLDERLISLECQCYLYLSVSGFIISDCWLSLVEKYSRRQIDLYDAEDSC